MDAAALTLPFLFALIAVALAFDFLNGMNDAANAIATIVSTRVLRQHFRAAHIDVVIAGHERHVLGRAETVEPKAPARELLGQRRQMRVGEMGEGEHQSMIPKSGNRFSDKIMLMKMSVTRYELPINMPARNTSTPPTTIWKVAARNGVSM